MRKLGTALFAALAACTSIQPAPPLAPAGDACLPSSLARYTGQPATSELGARMLRETGKTSLRWVRPGMAVTMDYREDRLTVFIDSAGRVERASCS